MMNCPAHYLRLLKYIKQIINQSKQNDKNQEKRKWTPNTS